MKFEPGKKYKNINNVVYKCVALDITDQIPIFANQHETESVKTVFKASHPDKTHWTEYKEPVVHRRDVVWYKLHPSSAVSCIIVPVGHNIGTFSDRYILHRQTVEYMEKE